MRHRPIFVLFCVFVLALLLTAPAFAHARPLTRSQLQRQNAALSKQVRHLKAELEAEKAREELLRGAVDDASAYTGGVFTDEWHFGEWNLGEWVPYVYAERFIVEHGLWTEYAASRGWDDK